MSQCQREHFPFSVDPRQNGLNNVNIWFETRRFPGREINFSGKIIQL